MFFFFSNNTISTNSNNNNNVCPVLSPVSVLSTFRHTCPTPTSHHRPLTDSPPIAADQGQFEAQRLIRPEQRGCGELADRAAKVLALTEGSGRRLWQWMCWGHMFTMLEGKKNGSEQLHSGSSSVQSPNPVTRSEAGESWFDSVRGCEAAAGMCLCGD